MTGADAVCRAVLRCWASLFTPHALAYFCRVDFGAVGVPWEKQHVPCLTDVEVVEIASLGKRIEDSLGSPQDIEWAIGPGSSHTRDLFFLQTRPAPA